MKHLLIANALFDDDGKSFMFSPSVSIYFDFLNKDKPIWVLIKYKSNIISLHHPFNNYTKSLFDNRDELKWWLSGQIRENILHYDGDLVCINKYVTEFGTVLPFSISYNKVLSLYKEYQNNNYIC